MQQAAQDRKRLKKLQEMEERQRKRMALVPGSQAGAGRMSKVANSANMDDGYGS